MVLIPGCAIGYRKGKNGGNWIARGRGPDGKQRYHAIGRADDALNQEQSGTVVLAYKEAQEQARQPRSVQLIGAPENPPVLP